jgi:hypothetical protein
MLPLWFAADASRNLKPKTSRKFSAPRQPCRRCIGCGHGTATGLDIRGFALHTFALNPRLIGALFRMENLDKARKHDQNPPLGLRSACLRYSSPDH